MEGIQVNQNKNYRKVVLFTAAWALFGVSGCDAFNISDDATSSLDPQAVRENQITALQNSDLIGKVDEYAAIQGVPTESPAPAPAKLFMIENDESVESSEGIGDEKYVYASLYFDLPEELQAKSDAEMNVLVKLRKYYQVTGTYSNGGNAYTRYVAIEILDKAAGTLIYQETLIGSAPFSISEKESSGYGYVPEYQVLEKILAFLGHTEE